MPITHALRRGASTVDVLWPEQVSAIEPLLAWALVGAGALVAYDAMRCRHMGATGQWRRQTPIASL